MSHNNQFQNQQENAFYNANTSGFDEYSSSEQHRMTLISKSHEETRGT